MSFNQTIAILGGGGALGSGIARRLAQGGARVIIGSRDPLRAADTVALLNAVIGDGRIAAAIYIDAARSADIIVVTVPFSAQRETLEAIRPHAAGKLVIDCTVPLKPPKAGLVQLPPEGSAAKLAQAALGPDVRIASALHNVGAKLLEGDQPVDCDVLVFSDDDAARSEAAAVVEAIGLRAIEAGPLANSAAAEALTSVLIQINRRYKANHAGIRITGLTGDH
jgi:8-hydroxy-5-deazaflavin:NADPH oxidoreductase